MSASKLQPMATQRGYDDLERLLSILRNFRQLMTYLLQYRLKCTLVWFRLTIVDCGRRMRHSLHGKAILWAVKPVRAFVVKDPMEDIYICTVYDRDPDGHTRGLEAPPLP
jgi:hypothetical protein